MKNILFLFGGKNGGIANYVKNIIDKPEKLNYFICSEESEIEIYESKFGNINIINFPINKGFIRQLININSLIKQTSNGSWTVNAHALKMGFLGIILKTINPKIRILYTDHGSPYKQKNSYLSRLVYFIVEYIVTKFSDKRIFIRKKEYEEWQKYGGIHKSNLLFIPTEIDLPAIKPRKTTTSNNLIIMTGKYYYLKNPELFSTIASQIYLSNKKIKFLWVGEGAEKSTLKGENLNFKNQLSRDEVIQLHQSASILLLTSRVEIVPLTVIEAMKYKTLVLSYAYEGVEELIEDNVTGYVFDSAVQAKNLIENLINNPSVREEIINNASNYVERERLNIIRFKQRYHELF